MAERAGDGAWFPLAQEILWDVRECNERYDVTVIWGVPKIRVPPKSSILIGAFHYKPIHFGDTPIFGNTHISPLVLYDLL